MKFQVLDYLSEDKWYPENFGDPEPTDFIVKKYTIYLFGRNEEGKSICAVVKNFCPSFYVLVPNGSNILSTVRKQIPKWLHYRITYSDYEKHMKGYGFTNNEQFTFVHFKLDNMIAFYTLRKFFTKTFLHNGKLLDLYESNVDHLLRFIHLSGIEASGWVEIQDKYVEIVPEEYKESYCDEEIHVEWDKVKHASVNKTAKFITASFDIEANSLLDNETGKPLEGDNAKVIQIATVFTRYGEKDPYLKHIITLKKSNPIEGVTVESYNTEKAVLKSWSRVIRQQDPDLIIGYNIWGYDLAYVLARIEKLGLKNTDHACLGRLSFKRSKVEKKTFDSGAYGHTDMWMVNTEGRCQLDLLIEIRKEHKLESYKLNDVSEYFLGENKFDVSYKQILDWYEEGHVDKITKIAEYCVQDTMLCQRLIDCNKLKMFVNKLELSKIASVPLQYILSKGQQVRILSLILREANLRGYLIPTLNREPFGDYDGAHVFHPLTGLHVNPITALDFASLYPSIIIAYNLDHTSFVDDEKYGNIEGVEYKTFEFSMLKTGEKRKYKFAQNVEGLIPIILKKLWEGRKETKRNMKKEKDPDLKSMYNGKQLAQKVVMNSSYGFCGAKNGSYSLLAIADVTTYIGRESVQKSAKIAKENFDCEIIYGDSVSCDTPILIRKNGEVDVVEIKDLFDEIGELEVYSDIGWTRIKHVMKHKTSKKMYRIHTNVGIVDVTEDHSLLLENGTMVRPRDVNIGTKLMYVKLN